MNNINLKMYILTKLLKYTYINYYYSDIGASGVRSTYSLDGYRCYFYTGLLILLINEFV